MFMMSFKAQMLILSAIPGAGKTTEALRWIEECKSVGIIAERINYDDLRLEMFGPTWRWNRADKSAMKARADLLARHALGRGNYVVIDNTNLTERVRRHWEALGKGCGAEVIFQEIDTPIAECKARDSLRAGSARVGWAVIDWFALHRGFIDWNDRELYPRRLVICDMDGTLSDCEWRRGFLDKKVRHKAGCSLFGKELMEGADFVEHNRCRDCLNKASKDWNGFFKNVEKDPINKPVVELAQMLYSSYDLIVVSGRPIDKCGAATEAWIKEHLVSRGIHIKHLFLRQSGDGRTDVEVKQEIADLLPLDRIAYVLDDRSSVVEMWRKAGLTTLQVASGDF